MLTVDDFLSLDFLRPEAREDLSAHQLLPVWRVVLRVGSLVVLALDVGRSRALQPAARQSVSSSSGPLASNLDARTMTRYSHLLMTFGVPSWALHKC